MSQQNQSTENLAELTFQQILKCQTTTPDHHSNLHLSAVLQEITSLKTKLAFLQNSLQTIKETNNESEETSGLIQKKIGSPIEISNASGSINQYSEAYEQNNRSQRISKQFDKPARFTLNQKIDVYSNSNIGIEISESQQDKLSDFKFNKKRNVGQKHMKIRGSDNQHAYKHQRSIKQEFQEPITNNQDDDDDYYDPTRSWKSVKYQFTNQEQKSGAPVSLTQTKKGGMYESQKIIKNKENQGLKLRTTQSIDFENEFDNFTKEIEEIDENQDDEEKERLSSSNKNKCNRKSHEANMEFYQMTLQKIAKKASQISEKNMKLRNDIDSMKKEANESKFLTLNWHEPLPIDQTDNMLKTRSPTQTSIQNYCGKSQDYILPKKYEGKPQKKTVKSEEKGLRQVEEIFMLQSRQKQNNVLNQMLNSLKTSDNTNDKTNLQDSIFKIQKLLGFYEDQIIETALKKLLGKQLTFDEARIYICSHCLIACLTVLKQYANKIILKFQENPCTMMNKINKEILEYLITKYPRTKNLLVQRKLDQQFENISFLNSHYNNILVNSSFSFTEKSPSRVQILNKAKSFLNMVINQLDCQFVTFSDKIHQKILQLKDSEIDLKLNKVKIGRKIPNNTGKYYNLDSEKMRINSPQMLRIMIKWTEALQTLLTNPSEVINNQSSIRYIKRLIGDQKVQFGEIQSKRFSSMKIDLIEKISNLNQWKGQINELLKKLNVFNNNLLNTLQARSPINKFMNEERAQILKFSKFNTLFLEWLIVEKFLILIKALCYLSDYFETKYFKRLDFINFQVFDLMRASFSGKKQQILEIFTNMRQLEQEGEITIVRVKNRLKTPLNDVLINFIIKESFIVCEIQLILVETLKEGQQKLKLTESFHHIVYQLNRTPYGSLSEMALNVGYYDPTIIYENKVKFEKEWTNDKVCSNGKQHSFIQINDQTTPFVCSWCVKFYGRQQNFFEYHQCRNCQLQKCKACVFQGDPIIQRGVYHKYFANCFFNIPLQKIYNDKEEDFIENMFNREEANFISSKYLKIRDEVEIETKPIKIGALQPILDRQKRQCNLKATDLFYCLLLKFDHNRNCLKVLKYVNYDISICMEDQQVKDTIQVQRHDALFFFKKGIFQKNSKEDESTFVDIPINVKQTFLHVAHYVKQTFLDVPHNDKQSFLDVARYAEVQPLRDIRNRSKIKTQKKDSYAVYIKNGTKNYLLDWKPMSQRSVQSDNQKIKQALDKVIKKCDSYKTERSCLQLDNIGLKYQHLTPILSRQWKRCVTVLNLSNNQISSIQKAFSDFISLEQLYLNSNQISDLVLQNKEHLLRVLDISFNRLTSIPPNINILASLQILKVGNNKITEFSALNLPNLEELEIHDNAINNFISFSQSYLPALEILNISNNKLTPKKDYGNVTVLSKLANLRKLLAVGINLEFESLNLSHFEKLEVLDVSNNSLNDIQNAYYTNFREIYMCNCKLGSLKNVFVKAIPHLQIIKFESNEIQNFPILKQPQLQLINFYGNKINSVFNLSQSQLPALKQLNLQHNEIKNIDALGQQQFPLLKKIFLQHNSIKNLPELNFPELVTLDLTNNDLENIDNLSNSRLDNLRRLLVHHNQITRLPYLKLSNLEEFNVCYNKAVDLKNFRRSEIPKLLKIKLWNNKIKEVPEMNLPGSQQLLLFNNNISDINNLLTSNLKKIKIVSLNNNEIVKIPTIRSPSLENFYAYKNHIIDIRNLEIWETPNLQVLDLNQNKIKYVPFIKQNSLIQLELSSNQIENLQDFSRSDLPKLLRLFLNNNENLKSLCSFGNFQKLEQFQANSCGLTNIDQFASHRLQNLKKLYVRQNQIESLPRLDSFINLVQFSIKGNKITQINSQCLNKKLRNLHLSRNSIQELRQETLLNSSIQKLSLSENPIKLIKIPRNLNLKYLSLKSCSIENLHGLYVPHLQSLYLQDNLIQDISFLNASGGFVALQFISLQKNLIKNIPSLNLPHLKEMSLKNNPIQNLEDILISNFPTLLKIYVGDGQSTTIKLSHQKSDENQILRNESDDQSIEDEQELRRSLGKSIHQQMAKGDFIRQFTKKFPKCRFKI